MGRKPEASPIGHLFYSTLDFQGVILGQTEELNKKRLFSSCSQEKPTKSFSPHSSDVTFCASSSSA